MYSRLDPDSPAGQSFLKMHFVVKSWEDIRKKLEKLDNWEDTGLNELLREAQKVYARREGVGTPRIERRKESVCFYCGNKGHVKRECSKRKWDEKEEWMQDVNRGSENRVSWVNWQAIAREAIDHQDYDFLNTMSEIQAFPVVNTTNNQGNDDVTNAPVDQELLTQLQNTDNTGLHSETKIIELNLTDRQPLDRLKTTTTKTREIEQAYRQDRETFSMVVKMLVEKDPSLEKPIQLALRQNLHERGERGVKDLKHFIAQYDAGNQNVLEPLREGSY